MDHGPDAVEPVTTWHSKMLRVLKTIEKNQNLISSNFLDICLIYCKNHLSISLSQ